MVKIIRKENVETKDVADVAKSLYYSAEIGSTACIVVYDNSSTKWRVAPVVTSSNSFIKGYYLNEFDSLELRDVVVKLVDKAWDVREHLSVEEMFIHVCRHKLEEYY